MQAAALMYLIYIKINTVILFSFFQGFLAYCTDLFSPKQTQGNAVEQFLKTRLLKSLELRHHSLHLPSYLFITIHKISVQPLLDSCSFLHCLSTLLCSENVADMNPNKEHKMV